MFNTITIIASITSGFREVREVDGSTAEDPLFDAQFYFQPNLNYPYVIPIVVDGPNKKRLERKCQAVLHTGAIRATGLLDTDGIDGLSQTCTLNQFMADDFQAVNPKPEK